MPCCCVLRFQGKARSERAERKVSTALILHGDLGLLGGNNEGMRSDLFFLFSFTNNFALGPLWVCSFLQKHLLLNLLLKFTLTHSNTHETLHNGITSPDELPREISTHRSQVINTSSACSGEWVTPGEVTAFHSCPLHLSSLLYLNATVLFRPR